MKHECAVVIKSTDSFSDVWGPALECLKRNWPDCPWPIFTTSERQPWGERPVMVGENRGWCRNFETALDQVDSEFTLLIIDDHLIDKPVNTAACIYSLDFLRENPVVCSVLLGPGGQDLIPAEETPMYWLTRETNYRISCSPTLWRTSYLRERLAPHGTAWDFELRGTPESVDAALAAFDVEKNRPIKCIYSAITRGEWERGALQWLHSQGIPVTPTHPIKD
jgi:hypothetical protein